MKFRGAVLVAIVALIAGVAVRTRERPLAPNEAVGVIPTIEGLAVGTRVWGPPGTRTVGEIEHIRRRGDELVIRIRFDDDSGIVRRRGDGLSVAGVGLGKRIVMFSPAPTYEKAGRVSDTLFVTSRDNRRPRTVEELLGTLYRGRPTLDSMPR